VVGQTREAMQKRQFEREKIFYNK